MSSPFAARPVDNLGHATHPALRKSSILPIIFVRHTNLVFVQDLRDARDAHVVFEAVRQGILPLITRRLTASEREQLTSGNVFVWEEAEHKQGEHIRQASMQCIHPRPVVRVFE